MNCCARPLVSWLAWAGILLAPAALGAAPAIQTLSLHGLQAGGTTTLTIQGSELGENIRVLLPVPIADQQFQPGASAGRIVVALTLDASVAAGIYPLRVAGPGGISNAVAVGIDALPQLPLAESVASLPAALSGNLTGVTTVRTQFVGKKGERIVVDLEARRLGAKLNPVLHLEDARGLQLAYSQAQDVISGDARLEVVLPADGQYAAVLHDALYRGAAPGHFRLKIGALHYADLVLPLAVRRGAKATLELASSNIAPDERVTADISALTDRAPAPWPPLPLLTGGRPQVLVSDFDEVLESPSDGMQQIDALPVGINGRLAAPHERDVYGLKVTPGTKLRIEVYAGRAGSPLDGVLTVRNAQGGVLARSDDSQGTVDPSVDFTVPGGMDTIQLALEDLTGRGGRDYVYRIAVVPAERGDFQLSVSGDRFLVPRDGATLVRVEAVRSGYHGPIKLQFSELPQGVAVSGEVIPAGATQALVSLTAPGAAPAQSQGTLVGTSDDGQMVRQVRIAGDEPWRHGQLAFGTVGPAPLVAIWQPASAGEKLVLGRKLKTAVRIQRAEGTSGAVRLTLLTSQVVPKKKVKENNKEVEVDDVARMLRLEGAPMLGADASEAELTLLVPADLPPRPYDLAVQAELLSADGKKVVLSGTTPAVRLEAAAPQPEAPHLVFEDQADFVGQLTDGKGQATLESGDKHSGAASLKVTPDQRMAASLPTLGVKIREFPEPGEYRYLRFAWKKNGGKSICLQLNHDGVWGPEKGKPAKFRYHAGPGPECFGASVAIDAKLPDQWTTVTRDLFADFGEFTLSGLAFAPVDGEFALFDHVYLARSPGDFEQVQPQGR